jgi:O-acetylserine/cysteine efflux transporter
MKPVDVALALSVALAWGLAFVFTKLALETLSPALLLAIRFALAALPALVLPRPALPLPLFLAVGATWFVGQFLFQFIGIRLGVPAGIAAVVVQSQALLTVAMAALFAGERPGRRQLLAMAAASLGLVVIAGASGGSFSLAALAVLMLSPASFAAGNILMRRVDRSDMAALVAWLSLVPPLPGLGLALALDDPEALFGGLAATSATGWLSALYLGLVATTFGYAVWGRLIGTYPAAVLAPFPLLVPVIGAGAAALFLGERFGPAQLTGMVLVLAGLAILLVPWPDRRNGAR